MKLKFSDNRNSRFLQAKISDRQSLICYKDKPYKQLRTLIYTTSIVSFLLCKFLTRDSCILKFSPADARMLEDGLVVPGTFSAFCKSRTMINILKTELEKKVIELAYMEIDVGDAEFKNAITYPK